MACALSRMLHALRVFGGNVFSIMRWHLSHSSIRLEQINTCKAVRWLWALGSTSTARGQHALKPSSLFWISWSFMKTLHVKSLISGLASSMRKARCQNKGVRVRNQGDWLVSLSLSFCPGATAVRLPARTVVDVLVCRQFVEWRPSLPPVSLEGCCLACATRSSRPQDMHW